MNLRKKLWNLVARIFAPAHKSCRRKTHASARLGMEYLEARWACTVVNSSTDIFELSDPNITLREAVFSAPVGDIITFSGSLNGKTILLDRGLGEIAIDKNLTISASTLSLGVTIDANDPTPTAKTGDGIRIFSITAGDVTMKNLTLKGADTYGTGGAINAIGNVSLTLDTVTLRDNGAAERGGGLYFETVETLSARRQRV